ncbi:MAG: hypothetical protein A2Z03_10690 [Chloroflexi bacterium RBG_16_56_8]|nr:MAG: hypothetical protein A2Z03_10690 [Chloroflexi bacterium RBG_16_56_8]
MSSNPTSCQAAINFIRESRESPPKILSFFATIRETLAPHASAGVRGQICLRTLVLIPLCALVVSACAAMSACAPRLTPTPLPAPAPATPQARIVPTPCPSPVPVPQLSGLTRQPELDLQSECVAVQYLNSAGAVIATFDPQDRVHNNGVTWNWERMDQAEKDRALAWVFDLRQMRYSRFEGREDWVIQAVTKWIPRFTDFSLPAEEEITLHWQTDGPPMSQATLYEALSRVKSLTLVRERPTCSYGYSHLGLVEYGAGMVLFESAGWQRVTQDTREIVTAAWTIKEAMVIYYPQWLGWPSSCPCETDHLKNEYYSTIWLVKAEQALSRFVPADESYWQGQEIPFQIRNVTLQRFPECVPAFVPNSAVKTTAEPRSSIR